jgi:hypothetical protein
MVCSELKCVEYTLHAHCGVALCADRMTLAAPAGVLFIRTVPEAKGDHRTAQASAGELSLHVEHPPFGLRPAHSYMTTVRAS